MATKTSYNEQVKLSASLINLMALGVITVGVTTPLVSIVYGSHILDDVAPVTIGLGILYLSALASAVHCLALLTLRSLIE